MAGLPRGALALGQPPRPVSLRTFANEDPTCWGHPAQLARAFLPLHEAQHECGRLACPSQRAERRPFLSPYSRSVGAAAAGDRRLLSGALHRPSPRIRRGTCTTGREAQESLTAGSSGAYSAPVGTRHLPLPGPGRSWLDVTEALGSRKCLGPSRAPASPSLCSPAWWISCRCQTLSLTPWCPPCYSRSQWGWRPHTDPGEPPGPLIPSLQSGFGSHPLGPESLARPWPRPPSPLASQSHFAASAGH